MEKREMAKDINDIKERIRALLMKAADAAASPAEAEGAMRLAQKLMATYQVAEGDLERVGEDDYTFLTKDGKTVGTKIIIHPIDRYCAMIVGKFCGVVPIEKTLPNDGGFKLELFGLAADVQLAAWMLDAFIEQFEHDWLLYKRFQMQTKRLLDVKEARKAFIHAFAAAIKVRLSDWLYRKVESPDGGTGRVSAEGTALAIRKLTSAEEELARRGFRLGKTGHKGSSAKGAAAASAAGAGYNSGMAASVGGKATPGGAQTLRIGK
jgi:hypothetical protein